MTRRIRRPLSRTRTIRRGVMLHARIIVCMALACAVMPLQAEIIGKEVEYEANGVRLVGFLAYDDAMEGQRPGVLVVHEWWGLNDYARSRARQLAELGYTAFAVD